jgi:hypothetical protein
MQRKKRPAVAATRPRTAGCVALIVACSAVFTATGRASEAAPAPSSFTTVSSPISDATRANAFHAVAAVSASDIWAVGFQHAAAVDLAVAAHYDGSRWSIVATPSSDPGDDNRLSAVAAHDTDDVWAVGAATSGGTVRSLVEHWDGRAWSIVPDAGGSAALSGIAVVAANDVWAVGTASTTAGPAPVTEHWDGTSWSAINAPAGSDGITLHDVGAAGTNVWAVGTTGTQTVAWQFNGLGWLDRSPALPGTLAGMAGTGSNDAWAVGDDGTHALALHWNGTSWSSYATPGTTPNGFAAIAPSAPNDTWAVGDQTTSGVTSTFIAHYDGVSWSQVSDEGDADTKLLDVAAISTTDIWAVGASQLSSVQQSRLETTPRSSATALISSADPSVSGQTVAYTATITGPDLPPTGTVTFDRDGDVVCNAVPVTSGTATCAMAYAAPSDPTLHAHYSGDDNYAPSSATVAQHVDAAATTTNLTSSVNPAPLGGSVEFNASVAPIPPGSGLVSGTVTFAAGAHEICSNVELITGTATCTTSFAAAGDEPVSASYSGDTAYLASASTVLDEVIAAGTTVTELTTDSTTLLVGESVKVTTAVHAVAPATTTPGGSITVRNGTNEICTATLASGAAECNTTFSHSGGHSLIATYGGDANFTGSASPAASIDVSPAPTTVTVTPSVTAGLTGEPVVYVAGVAPFAPGGGTVAGTVTFDDGGSPIPTCTSVALVDGSANCSQTYAGVGDHVVSASFVGTSDYVASVSSPLHEAINAAPTAIALAASVDPAVVGQPITITALVTAMPPAGGTPTGTLTFFDGSGALPSCENVALIDSQATCVVTYSAPGTHELSASYAGDGNSLPSDSPNLAESVGAAATKTTLSSSGNTTSAGTEVTYTAIVVVTEPGQATPEGSVAFFDAGTALSGCANVPLIGSVATCEMTYMAVGSHAITANYAGDETTAPSTSTTLTESVSAGTLSLSDRTTAPNSDNAHVEFTPILLNGRAQVATGALNTTRVSDNRGTLEGWTVSGNLESAFHDGSGSSARNHVVPGENLSWTPSVTPAVGGVPNVLAGMPSHLSTTAQSVLCSAPTGTGGASYDCNASLSLTVPASAAAGQYRGTIDLVLY